MKNKSIDTGSKIVLIISVIGLVILYRIIATSSMGVHWARAIFIVVAAILLTAKQMSRKPPARMDESAIRIGLMVFIAISLIMVYPTLYEAGGMEYAPYFIVSDIFAFALLVRPSWR